MSARDDEFLAVLEAEHAVLARVAYSIVRDEDDANDVLCDAVAKTYAQWRRGQVDDLAPYLTRAVRNTALDRTRRRRHQLKALELLAAEASSGAAIDDEPENSSVDAAVIDAKLRALSDQCRTIIELRVLQQLPVKDVAAQLLVSEGTVKSRCSRCLKRLGRSLGA